MPLMGADGDNPDTQDPRPVNGSDDDLESQHDLHVPLLSQPSRESNTGGGENLLASLGRRLSLGTSTVNTHSVPLMIPLFRRSFGGEVGGGFGSVGHAGSVGHGGTGVAEAVGGAQVAGASGLFGSLGKGRSGVIVPGSTSVKGLEQPGR